MRCSEADGLSLVGEPITSAMPRFGAFIPLLFFIFPGASSHCHTGTVNECKNHTAFVPGHSLAGEGIDVTTMARKGAYLVDSSLWQHQTGTCTLCRNRLQGGQWQRLPLAMVDWRVHVSCRWKLSSLVQQSAMGMMDSAVSTVQNDWKVGLDMPVKPKVNVQVALAGSHSKLASLVVDHERTDKYSFMSHEVSCGYCRVPGQRDAPAHQPFHSGAGEPPGAVGQQIQAGVPAANQQLRHPLPVPAAAWGPAAVRDSCAGLRSVNEQLD
ncbi:unnamed protein product [Natator depressus]